MRSRSLALVSASAGVLSLSLALTAASAAPPETTGLAWCAAKKSCLEWNAAPGATAYRLYRGEWASLRCVLNPSYDSCLDATTTASTADTVTAVPSAGSAFWYIVTATDGSGEGSPGSGTPGARSLNQTGPCAAFCRPAGATCGQNSDCCSFNCNGGVCQTNCCQPTGAQCSRNEDCCNGACSGGICAGPCSVDNDCPGGTECAARTCNAGMCGPRNAPYGTNTSSQSPGDCNVSICDGTGNIITVPDPLDPAVDDNQCSDDICSGGVPTHPWLPAGTSCHQDGGSNCDGNGACVQCVVAAQCPGADTTCAYRTCTTNQCGIVFAPRGTTCATGLCDGGGQCVAPPAVAVTSPADGAVPVARTSISVTFNMPMNPSTLTGQVVEGACSGSVQVSLDNFVSCIAFATAAPVMSAGNTTATLTPKPGLLVGNTYRIRVTTAAQSDSGDPLRVPFVQPAGFFTTSANLCDGSLVISQVYGAGGNSGATYRYDFVELHNRGTAPVSLAGKSIQYASAVGTTWQPVALSGSIPAGGYYLVQLASGGSSGSSLPAPDATSTLINLGATEGKLVLASTTTALAGACPSSGVLDMVGYGTGTNCSEGNSVAPAPSATTSIQRATNGCADLGVNGLDFAAGVPAPRCGHTPPSSCACVVRNESNWTLEADYCNVQFPTSITTEAGMQAPAIYGQLYEAGSTEPDGGAPNVRAQLGYGPMDANPEYEAGWSWSNAVFNTQAGNNDEYVGQFLAPTVGSYRYVYRFSLDSGVSWTYCDTNGAGSNAGMTFRLGDAPAMTVTP